MNISFHQLSVNLRDEDRNFLYVPLGLYLLKMWGLIRFFLTTYLHKRDLQKQEVKNLLDALLLMQSYGASAQATLNCVVFCFLDKTVRTRMKQWLGKVCPCVDNSEASQPLLSPHQRQYSSGVTSMTSSMWRMIEASQGRSKWHQCCISNTRSLYLSLNESWWYNIRLLLVDINASGLDDVKNN